MIRLTNYYFSLIAFILMGLPQIGRAEANEAVGVCRAFIESLGHNAEKFLSETDVYQRAITERHSLHELFAPDGENLILQHPSIVLSAPQVIWMIAKEAGIQEIPNPRTGMGTIPKYNLISRGAGLTDGRIVIGQELAISRLMATVKAQARGNKSSRSTPLLMGIRGTAKSELLEILKTALFNANLRNPRYFNYTFQFRDLDKIAALEPFLQAGDMGSQINDSPFTILPPALQDMLLQKMTPMVREAIQMDPLPKRRSDPQSQFYVEEILKHYAKAKGKDLTIGEMIEYLDRHIVIRRAILGTANNCPIITAQLKDVDEAGLFMSKNPAIAFQYGASHPIAWNNGRVPQGNRGITSWDELLKNDPSFLRKLLTILQAKRIQSAGGPELDLDTLFIASTNTEDVAAELERNPSSPLTDRFTVVVMNLLTEPQQIAKGVAYEQSDLMVRKLGTPDSKFEPLKGGLLHEVFPDRERPNQKVQTSDRRFALQLDLKDEQIHIAPHALMFMSMVAALTRMEFDASKLSKHKDAFPKVRWEDPMLRDRVARLKALLGQVHVEQAKFLELTNISKAANEGGFGMSHRDLQRWWELAVTEAQRDGNDRAITPMLLRKVLSQGIVDRVLVDGNMERGVELIRNADIVFENFIRPAMIEDMNLAIIGGPRDDVLGQIYDEVISEMVALSQDSTARTYLAPSNNQPKAINAHRLEEIKNLYRHETGRELSNAEVSTMIMAMSRGHGGSLQIPRNEGLMRAIQSYHSRAVQNAESVNMERFLKIARDPSSADKPSDRARASDFVKVLTDDLGYNVVSAHKAIEVVATPTPTKQPGSQ